MTENTVILKNTDDVVKAIRYAVRTRPYWVQFIADNGTTLDTVAEHSRALASLAYPDDKPVQKKDGKRTRYGNAVQAAAAMLRKVLSEDAPESDPSTPDWLRLFRQAAENAHKHEVTTQALLDALHEVVNADK